MVLHLKGAQGGKPLSTNQMQKVTRTNTEKGSEPVDEQLRISYGVIAEVNDDNQRVRIDLYGRGGSKIRVGAGVNGNQEKGAFVPIMQPLSIIHTLYGSLRKGLVVRVFWRGKHAPGKEAIAEVISDAEESIFRSGSEETKSNELATTPHDIFTGGVGL